jgi:hypothetical protein
MTIIIFELT